MPVDGQAGKDHDRTEDLAHGRGSVKIIAELGVCCAKKFHPIAKHPIAHQCSSGDDAIALYFFMPQPQQAKQ